jgi:predicted nucleic acid-binding protein
VGLTVIDAGVFIGFLDTSDAHHQQATEALAAAIGGGDSVVIPASAFAEGLVGPLRDRDDAAEQANALLMRLPMAVAPLDQAIAVVAAGIRSRYATLKLPDALVIATAQHLDADLLLTTDRRWPAAALAELRGEVRRV